MMRSLISGLLALGLALAGTGCSRSPRINFYTLMPAPRPAGSVAGAASAAGTLAPAAGTAPTRAGASTAAPAPAKPASGSAAKPGAATPAAATAADDAATAAPGAAPAPGTTAAAAPAATAAAAASPGVTPTSPNSAGTAAQAPVGAVVVGPVTLPELVDRPQLVVRVAPNRVDILEQQRWAEPLHDEIPRVIAEDLSRLLGSSLVSTNFQHAGPEPQCRVLLDVVRFEAAGEAVSVEVLWSLRRASGGASLNGRSLVREAAAGGGYDALVAAYGRALNAVSIDLARALSLGSAAVQ